MSIINDVEDVKAIWKTSSWPTRIFVLTTIFLSISSITSLSDVIFEWKGFILDAVEFYRSWIVQPFRSVVQWLGLNGHSRIEIDAIIILTLSELAIFRTGGYGKKYIFIFSLATVFLIITTGLSPLGSSMFVYFYIGIVITLLSVNAVITYRVSPTKLIYGYSPIFAAIIIVLLLGAVNAGLQR